MRISLLLFCLIQFGSELLAQIPQTEIYHFRYEMLGDSMAVYDAKLLTGFNPAGYNNQPAFLNNSEVVITSNYGDPAQTDIYKLNIKTRELTRLTATPASEYSPTPTPDRKSFSVIKQLTDEQQSQYLWKYPLRLDSGGQAIFTDLTTVGYHYWINSYTIAMFLVGQPHIMMVDDNLYKERTTVAENIGRCFQYHASNLYFIQKQGNTNQIRSYNHKLKSVKSVIGTLPGEEDFAISPAGHFVMGKGSILYTYNENKHSAWKRAIDLKDYGLNNISRLQINRNSMVIVNIKN